MAISFVSAPKHIPSNLYTVDMATRLELELDIAIDIHLKMIDFTISILIAICFTYDFAMFCNYVTDPDGPLEIILAVCGP